MRLFGILGGELTVHWRPHCCRRIHQCQASVTIDSLARRSLFAPYLDLTQAAMSPGLSHNSSLPSGFDKTVLGSCRRPAVGLIVIAPAGLTLHPDKTHIVDATQRGGFDFLGYHFERGRRWPSRKSLGKFRDNIRAKTRRCNGLSLEMIIASVNRSAKGWFEYFKHSRRYTFRLLDGWIRMRLRSVLRRRSRRRGHGRGWDHQRWPNAFFAERGLFSLATAYAAERQSPRG